MSGAEPASPCTGICTIDLAGLCLGCARTLDEIAAWPAASVAQKQEILARVAQRTLAADVGPA